MVIDVGEVRSVQTLYGQENQKHWPQMESTDVQDGV